ncbi:hypothetical protein [Streptomyces sp. NPDC050560]|uniref:hypothetical protein n=1 Tax=Streptomyces sp. NPDC050560 TaxID=3365630 RepID=UPI0037A0393F
MPQHPYYPDPSYQAYGDDQQQQPAAGPSDYLERQRAQAQALTAAYARQQQPQQYPSYGGGQPQQYPSSLGQLPPHQEYVEPPQRRRSSGPGRDGQDHVDGGYRSGEESDHSSNHSQVSVTSETGHTYTSLSVDVDPYSGTVVRTQEVGSQSPPSLSPPGSDWAHNPETGNFVSWEPTNSGDAVNVRVSAGGPSKWKVADWFDAKFARELAGMALQAIGKGVGIDYPRWGQIVEAGGGLLPVVDHMKTGVQGAYDAFHKEPYGKRRAAAGFGAIVGPAISFGTSFVAPSKTSTFLSYGGAIGGAVSAVAGRNLPERERPQPRRTSDIEQAMGERNPDRERRERPERRERRERQERRSQPGEERTRRAAAAAAAMRPAPGVPSPGPGGLVRSGTSTSLYDPATQSPTALRRRTTLGGPGQGGGNDYMTQGGGKTPDRSSRSSRSSRG